MSNWLHRLFNPHCSYCMAEKEDSKICMACESKNAEIARLQLENEKLLNHIINPKIEPTTPPPVDNELKPILPHAIPWRVRKRMLEEADRAVAQSQRNAAKPDAVVKDEEVEKLEEVLLDPNIPTQVALGAD